MMFHLRNAAVGLALLAGVGAVAAQSPTMGSRLQLTPVQKAQVYRTLAAESAGSGMKQASGTSTNFEVGSALPEATPLRDIPRSTVAQLPVLGRYKFAVSGDEVAIVEPNSRQVIDILSE